MSVETISNYSGIKHLLRMKNTRCYANVGGMLDLPVSKKEVLAVIRHREEQGATGPTNCDGEASSFFWNAKEGTIYIDGAI